jgi:hypothetical protein
MHPGLLCLSSRGSRPSRMLTQRVATSAAPQTASRSNRMPSGCSPLRAAGARCACTRAGPTRLSPQERATRPLGKPDATFVAGFKTWLELGTGSAGTRRRFRIIAPMPINERERPNGEETGEPLTRRKAVSLLHRLGQASICARRWARARLGRGAGAWRLCIGRRAAPAVVKSSGDRRTAPIHAAGHSRHPGGRGAMGYRFRRGDPGGIEQTMCGVDGACARG